MPAIQINHVLSTSLFPSSIFTALIERAAHAPARASALIEIELVGVIAVGSAAASRPRRRGRCFMCWSGGDDPGSVGHWPARRR